MMSPPAPRTALTVPWSTPPVSGGGGGGVVPPGRFHCWFAAFAHVQICRRVPLAELFPVTSRHFPEPALTRFFEPLADHFWAPVPLQSQSWIGVPSAVPALVT